MSAVSVAWGVNTAYDSYQLLQKSTASVYVPSKPVAIINGYVVDENGVLISSVTNEVLPTITTQTDSFLPGDRLGGDEFLVTLHLLQLFASNAIAVNAVTIYSKDLMILTVSDTIRVLYNSSSSPQSLFSSLQTMLSVFTIEGTVPEEIDFRFEKPVIRY